MPSISLTNPANITSLVFNSISTQKLGGSLRSLSRFTNLEIFSIRNHQLTGPIPSLSSNTALKDFFCYNNQLTGNIPSVSSNTVLKIFNCFNNQLTGNIPSLSSNTVLEKFHCGVNQLSGYVAGSVPTSLLFFRAEYNQLTVTAVNAILADFVAAGALSGTLNLAGFGNAAPTGQGLTDKQTLLSRGWSVTTN